MSSLRGKMEAWRARRKAGMDSIETADMKRRQAVVRGTMAVGVAVYTALRQAQAQVATSPTTASNSPATASGALTSRSLSSHFSDALYAKDFGAFGDGSAHAASTVYGSLGALQAAYGTTVGGVTIALTNELDWLAHQKAIDILTTGGGILHTTTGVYTFSNSNSVSDGSGTLTFPTPSGGATEQINATLLNTVSWVGDGMYQSICKWPSDLGSGHFAVTIAGRTGATAAGSGVWQDLAIIGPNAGVALNAKPANMHGFGWASNRNMLRVSIAGFNGGLCIPQGDQSLLQQITFYNCFYGIYYDTPASNGASGDIIFERLRFDIMMKACIGVSNACNITSTVFIKCAFATSPYAIFKETGGGQNVVLENVDFMHCQFELLGNAAVSDGLAAGSHVATTAGTVRFSHMEWIYSATYNIAALPQTGVFGLRQNFGNLEIGADFEGNWNFTSFTHGIFEIDFPAAGINLSGDMDTLLGTLNSASLPIGFGNFNAGACHVKNTGLNGWEATVFLANGNPTLVIGDIVAMDTGGNLLVNLSGGTATEQVLGIVALPHRSSAGAVVVIQRGYAPTVNARSNAITNGTWARASSSGTAITSTGIAQTTSRNIGLWTNGSGTAPNLKGSVFLQGIG